MFKSGRASLGHTDALEPIGVRLSLDVNVRLLPVAVATGRPCLPFIRRFVVSEVRQLLDGQRAAQLRLCGDNASLWRH